MEPERVESSGRKRSLDEAHEQMVVLTVQMHQKHRRERWKQKIAKAPRIEQRLFEWVKNENRPHMRVLQQEKNDGETKEVRTLMADPEEIHDVIAKAWQDISKRWDKEVTWQHFERNYQHLWDTHPQMEMSELQVDQMTKK